MSFYPTRRNSHSGTLSLELVALALNIPPCCHKLSSTFVRKLLASYPLCHVSPRAPRHSITRSAVSFRLKLLRLSHLLFQQRKLRRLSLTLKPLPINMLDRRQYQPAQSPTSTRRHALFPRYALFTHHPSRLPDLLTTPGVLQTTGPSALPAVFLAMLHATVVAAVCILMMTPPTSATCHSNQHTVSLQTHRTLIRTVPLSPPVDLLLPGAAPFLPCSAVPTLLRRKTKSRSS